MAKLLKLRRGTTSQHSSFTGAEGECTVDTDKETLVVHNGSTAGGFALARADNPDNQKVRFGTGNDLEIYHDGSENWIKGATSGQNLNVRSQGSTVFTVADTENAVICNANGAVQLYYDSSKKFETAGGGVNIIGDDYHPNDSGRSYYGTGNDLAIWHDGSHSRIGAMDGGDGRLIISGRDGSANAIGLQLNAEDSKEAIVCRVDGSVDLYHNGTKKIETTSGGVTITGNAVATSKFRGNDDVELNLGDGEDFQIWHNGTHSFIENTTGDLRIIDTTGILIRSNSLDLRNGPGDENYITCTANGAVSLYYDHSKKLETTSTGITVNGTVKPSGGNLALMDSSAGGNGRATFGGGDDLQIYHDGNNSYVTHNGGGDLLIDTEGSGEDIYIRSQDNLYLRTNNNAQDSIICVGNGQVELYNANVKQVQTGADGLYWADSKKAHFGNNSDIQIYHDGSHSYITNNEGDFTIDGNGDDLILQSNDDILIRPQNGENGIVVLGDAGVELYYDNSKKFEVTSAGAHVWGNLDMNDNAIIRLGTGTDFKLHHDATDSYITSETGYLYVDVNEGNLRVESDSSWANGKMAQFIRNGAVELYYDNTKRIETTAAGTTTTGKHVVITPEMTLGSTLTDSGVVVQASSNMTANYALPMITASPHATNIGRARAAIAAVSEGGTAGMALAFCTRYADDGSDLDVTADEQVRILSGGGITFNGDTSSNNALDDYEEGTFSASYSATGYSSTAATNEYYIKIGRLVWFTLLISPAANAADGDLTITGLPFSTSGNTARANGHWQDGASFNITGGRINGTQIERCNAVAFPNHSSGNATWVWSGTYQTA